MQEMEIIILLIKNRQSADFHLPHPALKRRKHIYLLVYIYTFKSSKIITFLMLPEDPEASANIPQNPPR